MGALDDIRVLEVGTLLAGPFSGRLLGDFGAEVIKIEPPDREDPMRKWGKQIDGLGLVWPVQSRNKKSITLNLREPEGQQVFRELAAKADVVIENFRPGTMEKWGLGYEDLEKVNPRIIFVRTSGYGQTGPYSKRAGFGTVGEAMGGIRFVTGYPDRPPTRLGISIGDSLAAVYATIGCLAAIHERSLSGHGQVVDTAIYEAVFSMMEGLVPEYDLTGYVKERTGNILPGIAPSNVYRTKENDYIVMGANSDTVFKRLVEAMGQPELASDPRYCSHTARGKNMEELDKTIEVWTSTLETDLLLSILAESGVPSGKIYSVKDIVNDPQYLARDMILNVDHPYFGKIKMPGIVPKLSRTPGEVKAPGSTRLGEHNERVYTELLGYSSEKMEWLKGKNII